MAARQLLTRLIEQASDPLLNRMFDAMRKDGINPRIRVGQVWCIYDSTTGELLDEKTRLQVDPGFNMQNVQQIDWGTVQEARQEGQNRGQEDQNRGQQAGAGAGAGANQAGMTPQRPSGLPHSTK